VNGQDWQTVISAINLDVSNIIRAQRTRSDIYESLERRYQNLQEEDSIFSDAFGYEPGISRSKFIDGVEIQTRMLHRQGLRQEDIMGADLLYEIQGKKFAIIQYKKSDGRKRVKKDTQQIRNLIDARPNACDGFTLHLFPTCGSWHRLISESGSYYMPACLAESTFGDQVSLSENRFFDGIDEDTFSKLFGRCWIGARTNPKELSYLTWSTLSQDRVLFTAIQKASFGF
jgi:hypothetical protein